VPAAWAAEALLVLIRWLHGLAAVAFVGTAFGLYLGGSSADPRASRRFKDVVEVTLLVFLATGAVLAFDRLSHEPGPVYAVLLVLKLAASVAAYQCAFRWRRRGLRAASAEGRLVLGFGAAAVLLAAALLEVFERGLRS
jgi:uncharacterized membrane protein